NCFPLLEVVDISDPVYFKDNQVEYVTLTFFKLRKVNLSGLDYIAELLFRLFKNCPLLEEVILLRCYDIAYDGVSSALREAPRLTSLTFSTGYGPVDEEDRESYITSQFIASLVSLKYLTSLDLLSTKISDELLFSIANEGLPLTRLVLQALGGYSYSGIF
ncbi:F-box/LRR-repeat protein, partial [Trifolium medium]|nr:F-box/LRR-repeat protein [Trifolium medium]